MNINYYIIAIFCINILLFMRLQKMRAETEKTPNNFNKAGFPPIEECSEEDLINLAKLAYGQKSSKLFAEEWFYKEDVLVKVKL